MPEDLGVLCSISLTITTPNGKPLEGVKVTSGTFTGISDKNGKVVLK